MTIGSNLQTFGFCSDRLVAPLFSHDGRFVLMVSSGQLTIWNAKAARCLATMGQQFRFLLLDPNDGDHAIAITKQGMLSKFHIEQAKLVETNQLLLLDETIDDIRTCSDVSNKDTSFGMVIRMTDGVYKLVKCSLGRKRAISVLTNLSDDVGGVLSALVTVNGTQETGFAMLSAEGCIHTFANDCLTSSTPKMIRRRFLCGQPTVIAAHPQREMIAFGTSSGDIIFWYDFLSDHHQCSHSFVHWHHAKVTALTFSAGEGSWLLSGGIEAVLVKWNTDTWKNTFLPRLEAPINAISCSQNGNRICIRHDNNCIRIATSSLDICNTLCCPNHLDTRVNFPKLEYVYQLNRIIMNSIPGHIQIIDPTNARMISQLDVTSISYVTSMKNESYSISQTDIEHMAVDSKGTWLATVEGRKMDGHLVPFKRLRLFRYAAVHGTYRSVLVLKLKNDKCSYVDLKFRPIKENGSENSHFAPIPELWGLGSDGDIVRWTFALKEVVGTNKSISVVWNFNIVHSSGLYGSPRTSQFSARKPLVAFAYAECCILWNMDHSEVSCMTPLNRLDPVQSLHFTGDFQLIIVGLRSVYRWDFIRETVQDLLTTPEESAIDCHCYCEPLKMLAVVTGNIVKLIDVNSLKVTKLSDQLEIAGFKMMTFFEDTSRLREADIGKKPTLNHYKLFLVMNDGTLWKLSLTDDGDEASGNGDSRNNSEVLPDGATDILQGNQRLGILLESQRTVRKQTQEAYGEKDSKNLKLASLIDNLSSTDCFLIADVDNFCTEVLKSILISPETKLETKQDETTIPRNSDQCKDQIPVATQVSDVTQSHIDLRPLKCSQIEMELTL